MPDLLEAYLADRTAQEKPGVERLAWAHKALTHVIAEWRAETLNPDRCYDYRDRRRAAVISDRTIPTEL